MSRPAWTTRRAVEWTVGWPSRSSIRIRVSRRHSAAAQPAGGPDYQEEAVAALGGQYGELNSVNKQRRSDAIVTKIDALYKGRTVIHLVRDEGVAGSNPATP